MTTNQRTKTFDGISETSAWLDQVFNGEVINLTGPTKASRGEQKTAAAQQTEQTKRGLYPEGVTPKISVNLAISNCIGRLIRGESSHPPEGHDCDDVLLGIAATLINVANPGPASLESIWQHWHPDSVEGRLAKIEPTWPYGTRGLLLIVRTPELRMLRADSELIEDYLGTTDFDQEKVVKVAIDAPVTVQRNIRKLGKYGSPDRGIFDEEVIGTNHIDRLMYFRYPNEPDAFGVSMLTIDEKFIPVDFLST